MARPSPFPRVDYQQNPQQRRPPHRPIPRRGPHKLHHGCHPQGEPPPSANPHPKNTLIKEAHSLLRSPNNRIVYTKKDCSLRCPKKSKYASRIDRFRRTTMTLLPMDPISGLPFCGNFFYCGWCLPGYSLPHHQSIIDTSVSALTDYGDYTRIWAAANQPTEEELARSGKRKRQRWDAADQCSLVPAPVTPGALPTTGQ